MRSKNVAFAFEELAGFRIVEKFAVENSPDGLVFVDDRLLTIGEADNRKSAVGEREPGPTPETRRRPARDGGWPGP